MSEKVTAIKLCQYFFDFEDETRDEPNIRTELEENAIKLAKECRDMMEKLSLDVADFERISFRENLRSELIKFALRNERELYIVDLETENAKLKKQLAATTD